MFRKGLRHAVAIDHEAGVRIDFDWMIYKAEDGYLLYQINEGPGYLLMLDIAWRRRGFFLLKTCCYSVDLKWIRQAGERGVIGPPIAISDELHERIAEDLLSAARCLGIHCELTYGE